MNPMDTLTSSRWAFSFITSGSLVVAFQVYHLVNLETKRAHFLVFTGGGLTLGTDIPKMDPKDPRNLTKYLDGFYKYKSFRTSKRVSFDGFQGRGARLTGIKVPFGHWSKLSIKAGSNPLGKNLAVLRRKGWGWRKSVSGQAAVHGAVFVVYMDDARPRGTVDGQLQIEEEFEMSPRVPGPMRIPAFESPRIVLPGDTLFAFDKSSISLQGQESLLNAIEIIENRATSQVVIEGHTDSIGTRAYNQGLSMRRAAAVKRFLIEQECEGASNFLTVAKGEDDPVAHNSTVEGRKLNRRVEIRFQQ